MQRNRLSIASLFAAAALSIASFGASAGVALPDNVTKSAEPSKVSVQVLIDQARECKYSAGNNELSADCVKVMDRMTEVLLSTPKDSKEFLVMRGLYS